MSLPGIQEGDEKHGDTTGIFCALRVRPFVPRELHKKEKRCLDAAHGELMINHPHTQNGLSFPMDEILDSSVDASHPYYADQARVYQRLGKRVLTEVSWGKGCGFRIVFWGWRDGAVR